MAKKARDEADAELSNLEASRKDLIRKLQIDSQSQRVPLMRQRLHQIESRMRVLQEPIDDMIGEDIVFHLNDSSASYDPNGFKPTRNTYIAVYHLHA